MKKLNNKKKRELRNRKKLKSVSTNRFRISIFKSLKNISAQIIDDKMKKTLVSASSIEKEIKASKKKKSETSVMWGTYRSLINNAVLGVSKGHEKILELKGVGFRATLKGEILNLQLGFSHDINFKIPKEVKMTVEKQIIITITGVDKELVSKVASDIKAFKPVEPYKGKGIRERGQFVLRKEGKKK